MGASDIEPLEPGVWFTQLEQLLANCADAIAEAYPDRLLRRLVYLLQLAPRPFRDNLGLVPEKEIEAMLDQELWESAALRLVSPPLGFLMPSAENSESCQVAVMVAGRQGPLCEASSLAIAIMSALCSSLLELREPEPVASQSMHFH